MSAKQRIHHLYDHLFWADLRLLDALKPFESAPAEALREFAHIIGAEEVWLGRLEGRTPALPVWPDPAEIDVSDACRRTHESWRSYLSRLGDSGLERSVTYANSAGREFTNEVESILMHVALHGQYHRGRVNVHLRQAGNVPAPVDYIAFVRGAPTATEADAKQVG